MIRTHALVAVFLLIVGCSSEKPGEEVSALIRKTLDEHVVSAIDEVGQRSFIESQYPVLQQYDEDYRLLPPTKVFLYYEGLDSGSFWTKPGALNFGGEKLGSFSFSSGPVPAEVVAHKPLDGGRNYFYVVLGDSRQGWVGRPYVKMDAAGREFLMPNPLTGERIQTAFKIPETYYVERFRSERDRYIPSYESIRWDTRIPERFRREGYQMYRSAVSDGYAEVDRLVAQYMSSH